MTPLSPSLSTASSSPSTPGPTQAPTSNEERLLRRGISRARAGIWRDEYNRASVPLIHDHLFDDLLIEIASHTDPADAEFESRLKEHMEQKSAASRTGYTKAAYDIMMLAPEIFPNNTQMLAFISALDDQYTVHSHEALVQFCLPELIKARQNPRSKNRQRNNTRLNKTERPPSRNVTKNSVGKRRSPRIMQQLKTPSE
jgi:hypothetical protein